MEVAYFSLRKQQMEAASFDQKEEENGRREHYSADFSSIQKTLITDRKRKTKGERRERERERQPLARSRKRKRMYKSNKITNDD